MGVGPGLWHVMARGSRKLTIFANDGERQTFLQTLHRIGRDHEVCVHAWALMTNHYHLLLSARGADLATALRDVNRMTARRFNRAHDLQGTLFEGPFVSFLVGSKAWAARTMRYIHLNPVAAGVCRKAGDSGWTNYRETVSGEASLADPSPVLEFFGGNGEKARADYAKFVESAEKPVRAGSEEETIRQEHARWIGELAEESLRDATLRLEPRALAAYLGREALEVPLRILAERLGYASPGSCATVVHHLRGRAEEEPRVRQAIRQIRERLDI